MYDIQAFNCLDIGAILLMTTTKNNNKFLIESHINENSLEEIDSWVYVVLPNLDYEAHLVAIKHMLYIHENDEKSIAEDIEETDNFIKNIQGAREDYIQFLIDEQVGKFHYSVYQSAAHSMAAVGMLAPFIESIFYQAFHGIKKEVYRNNKHPNDHHRWQKDTNETWDCHFVWKNNPPQKNLVGGILQLSDATGLKKFLPEDIANTLTVLFSYRNKMFHHGFEWPIEERHRFWERTTKENWPANWLSAATSDGEPWVIYLTNEFITHCINSIEQIITGISRFVYTSLGNEKKTNRLS